MRILSIVLMSLLQRLRLIAPEALNALNQPMWRELGIALKDAENDERVRVVILNSVGRSFYAGYDVIDRVGQGVGHCRCKSCSGDCTCDYHLFIQASFHLSDIQLIM